METSSSYLFRSKRKRFNLAARKMEKHSSSDSNISIDSLEADFKKKTLLKGNTSNENVETILVPFYEKDVLIKVPRTQGKNQKDDSKFRKTKEKHNKDLPKTSTYLFSRDHKDRRTTTTYLEMFRKQFTSSKRNEKQDFSEIRSLSPEYGDTERESIGEENNSPKTEFFNTESYNEIYYERLLNHDLENYLDNSDEEELKFTEDISSKPHGDLVQNLKSVSEISQTRRHFRRSTGQPIPNIKLGGLGPDIERIKPRLERARSLQRYSEKVRMENRVKIYKKSIQDDIDKKAEKDISARRRNSAREQHKENQIDTSNTSYLINKTIHDKNSKLITSTINHTKSKSAKTKEIIDLKERVNQKERSRTAKTTENDRHKSAQQFTKPKKIAGKEEEKTFDEIQIKERAKLSAKNRGINTEAAEANVSPLHISFLVNVGGVRPSTALRRLEEKHQLYQDQVKGFNVDKNNI